MFSLTDILYKRDNLNNAVLSSIKAMPLKDLSSDNDSSFAIGRKEYVQTILTTTNTTNAQKVHKRWMNGSHDGASVASRRKIKAIGNGSLNAANVPMSFVNDNERNLLNRERIHCRSGGARVPQKVINSKHFTHSVCIPIS